MPRIHIHTIKTAKTSVRIVKKSTRYYNNPDKVMPGAVFLLEGQRYIMTGQLCNGKYCRAYGQENRNFPAKDCRIVSQNTGLVYM